MLDYFRSVLEQDLEPVVICDMNDIIIYMNPAAVDNYKKWGGKALLGTSVLDCHKERSKRIIKSVVRWFGESVDNNIIHTVFEDDENKDIYMVALRDANSNLIGYYEKHECRTKDITTPGYEVLDEDF